MEGVAVVVRRLLRRALSVIFMSVGFFMVLTWVWGNYVGEAAIAIAYLIAASLLYSHVFKPLLRFRDVSRYLPRRGPNVFKYGGFTASALGILALATTLAKALTPIPSYIPALLGASAVATAVATLVAAALSSSGLLGLPEALASLIIALSIPLYLVKPSLVLPVVGASLMATGMFTYWAYYLRSQGSNAVAGPTGGGS